MQALLSRLEFPMNAWFGGVVLLLAALTVSRSAAKCRAIFPVHRPTFARRLDWTGETRAASVKDVYSEAGMRIEPATWRALMSICASATWSACSEVGSISGRSSVCVGRIQFRRLHDGVQSYPAQPGSAVDAYPRRHPFQADVLAVFPGARMAYDVGRHVDLPGLEIYLGQLDWAYVTGDKLDHHLLRAGRAYHP